MNKINELPEYEQNIYSTKTEPETGQVRVNLRKDSIIDTYDDKMNEEIFMVSDNQSQLNHINKARPKRLDIKKQTIKHPYTNIEIEVPLEDLSQVKSNDLSLKDTKLNSSISVSLNTK